VFEAGRPKLVPYRGRFDGFHSVPASVSKTCLVRFDNNKYSVAASAVGRPVEVHARDYAGSRIRVDRYGAGHRYHRRSPAGNRKVERFGWTFAPGNKVMQIENDYDKEVYNGDIGYIDDVDPNADEIVVSFDGRSVTYGFGELNMLVPAYAATIHKSQGSDRRHK
jgi:hypothetical protein